MRSPRSSPERMRRADDLPRTQRNAVAEVILGALRSDEGRAVLALLSRGAPPREPVLAAAAIASRLERHGLVTTAGAGPRLELALAPALMRRRDVVATRVRLACSATDDYWRAAPARAEA